MWMWRARGERVMSKGGLKFKELRVWQKGKEPCGLHLSDNKKKLLRR